MGTVIQAGHIFSGGTIVSIPPAGGDSTLYYLVSSHLPSDYAVYLYDSSGNELARIPKPNDASDSWGNNIGTNDTKIAITDNDGNGALYIYDMDGSNMVEVTSSDASGNDRFGSQLEINSTKIIVGAPYAGPIHQQGSVYVYDLDGTNEVKITASDGAYGDQFSTWGGLAVSESKIFVGSGNHDNKRGALYIYDMDGSNEVKVQSSDNAQNDEFGYIVAASETKVVATAAGSGAHGSAYIFDHDGTNEVKVEPSVDSRNNAFGGASAAINDTHVAIADRAFNGQKGAIYIYNIDGSNEVRIEHPSHFAAYDFFGYNLAMSSSKVFTCPPNDDDGGSSTGNVYEYNLDGTGERTLPTPSTFAAGSRFGQGLYIYDSSLVPSAPTFIAPLSTTTSYLALGDPHYKNSSNQSVGGVYIYNQSDMSAPVTILEGVMYSDSGINYGIHLGSSILLTDTHIIVGNSVNHNETSTPVNGYGKTPQIMIWSLDDLSSPPTTISHPLGSTAGRFGTLEGSLMVMGDKLFLQGVNGNDCTIYVYDLTDLSANPIEITPNLSGWNITPFGASFDIDPVSKKLYVGAWSSSIDGATYRTLDYSSGIVLVYDVSDLSSNINTHTATILNTDTDRDWNDKFGSCVRYHNGKLFIGHLAEGNRKEDLYVYDTSDLSFIQKFSAENIGQYGWGGKFAAWPRSVYVSDKGVVIGAPTSSPNEDDYSTGEVFVIPMDSSGNLGTLTKLSNSGLSVADGDRLGEHVSSFGDKIYATHKGSSGNNMKTVEWSWSNLSSNGSELSIVDPRSTFTHNGYSYTGMGVSPVPSLPTFIAPPRALTARYYLVNALMDDDNGSMSGSVYVYDANDLSATPTKLTAFDGVADDKFGLSMGANDDKIVIGSRSDGGNGTNSGSVYVYDVNDLSATPTKLTAFDGAAFDFFSNAIGVSNDKIVVGATHDDDNGSMSGSVYVYDATDLTAQPTKLTAFDGAELDLFGYTIGVSNDKIVVGVLNDDDNGTNSGSVYVYDVNDLSATPTKLTAFDGAEGDWFARSVSIDDNKIVVGAVWDDDNGTNSGSVYVYDANDLSATPTKLTAFDGAEGDYFGWKVVVSDDNIVVGGDDSSVYVYDANDLTAQPTKLTAFDGAADDKFGHVLSIVGDKILVGAYADDDNGPSSGSVYVYDANDLTAQPTKLTAFDGAQNDYFGNMVGIVPTS